MRITNEVMPLLPGSLNLSKVQPGFKLRFAGSKDYAHFTTQSASLGLFSLSDRSVESENALKATGNHRDFLGNTSVYTWENLDPQRIYNLTQIKSFMVSEEELNSSFLTHTFAFLRFPTGFLAVFLNDGENQL